MSGKVRNWIIALLAAALCVGLAVQGSVMTNRLKRMEEARDGALAQFNEQTEALNQARTEHEQQEKALNEQLESVQSELKTAQAELADAQAERDSAQTGLKETQADLKTAQAERDSAQAELEETRADLKTAQTELETARGELESLREEAQRTQRLQTEYDELKRELQREKGIYAQARSELSAQKSQISALESQIEEYKKEIERLKLNQKPEPTPTPSPVSGETVESGFIRVTPAQDVQAQTDEKGILLTRDGITVRVRPMDIDAREMAGMEPWQFANYMRLEDGAFRTAVLDEGESLTIKREQQPQALEEGTGAALCFTAQGDSGNLSGGWAMRVEGERAAAVYAFAAEGQEIETLLSEVMAGLSFA